MPRPTYFLAILTTRRRLASMSRRLASSSPFSIRWARSTSCSGVSRATLPISLRYMRTGSSMEIPSTPASSCSSSLGFSAATPSSVVVAGTWAFFFAMLLGPRLARRLPWSRLLAAQRPNRPLQVRDLFFVPRRLRLGQTLPQFAESLLPLPPAEGGDVAEQDLLLVLLRDPKRVEEQPRH